MSPSRPTTRATRENSRVEESSCWAKELKASATSRATPSWPVKRRLKSPCISADRASTSRTLLAVPDSRLGVLGLSGRLALSARAGGRLGGTSNVSDKAASGVAPECKACAGTYLRENAPETALSLKGGPSGAVTLRQTASTATAPRRACPSLSRLHLSAVTSRAGGLWATLGLLRGTLELRALRPFHGAACAFGSLFEITARDGVAEMLVVATGRAVAPLAFERLMQLLLIDLIHRCLAVFAIWLRTQQSRARCMPTLAWYAPCFDRLKVPLKGRDENHDRIEEREGTEQFGSAVSR